MERVKFSLLCNRRILLFCARVYTVSQSVVRTCLPCPLLHHFRRMTSFKRRVMWDAIIRGFEFVHHVAQLNRTSATLNPDRNQQL